MPPSPTESVRMLSAPPAFSDVGHLMRSIGIQACDHLRQSDSPTYLDMTKTLGFITPHEAGCEGLSSCMTSFHPALGTGRGASLLEAPRTPEVVRTRPLGFAFGILCRGTRLLGCFGTVFEEIAPTTRSSRSKCSNERRQQQVKQREGEEDED